MPDGNQVVDLFANDLSVDASCSCDVSNNTLLDDLRAAQHRAHSWGRDNRVTFDPGKEHFMVIHPEDGDDECFRFLGTFIDCHLKRTPCIDQIVAKIRPKTKALLRTRGSYSVVSMLNQFRTHILCHIECSQGALLLAIPSQLQRFDHIPNQFLGHPV